MLTVIPIQAFKDNYIWLLVNPANTHCAIVDPGDANPVLRYLQQTHLTPTTILITHHHHDHTGGIVALKAHYPAMTVYGPANETIAGVDHCVDEPDSVSLPALGLTLQVLAIPGHTRGHIAYYGHQMLFCGDTLFGAGCGRLFEGTPAEMYTSLQKMGALPDDTLVYCAHEYTAANLRFAETVEPNNHAIQQRIEAVAECHTQHQPTLPSLLVLEKSTNPFLRCEQSAVKDAVQHHVDTAITDPVAVFQALRAWKDKF